MYKLTKLAFGVALLGIAFVFSGCNVDNDTPTDPIVEQYTKDLQIIDKYLTDNGIQAEIDPNTGIRYIINEQGTGLQPYVTNSYFPDSLTVSYSGQVLTTGVPVPEVVSEKQNINQMLLGVIAGSTLIQEGGDITTFLPSYYGFGTTSTNDIPANSVLELDIQLEQVHSRILLNQINIIDDTLAARGITASIHPSGIRYTLEQGIGLKPTVNSNVTVNYEGRRLNGEVFDKGENVSFNLNGLIEGWRIMIPEIKEGGKMTMYIPSPFGYGAAGQGSAIPPNTILIFDVELIMIN